MLARNKEERNGGGDEDSKGIFLRDACRLKENVMF
jgi:hypothetical protein